MSPYGEDLALVHVESTDHAESAAPGLLALLAQAGFGEGHVVDLGCGDGGWCVRLEEAGFQAHGVDLSPAMVARARGRGATARFTVGSLLEVSWPICVAVTALGEVLNYQFDTGNTWERLVECFARIFDALVPGGLLIFDVAGPGRCPEPRQVFHGGEEWMVLVETLEDHAAKTLTRKIITFRRVGAGYRRSDETHSLQIYSSDAFKSALTAIGFTVEIVEAYGEYAIPFPGSYGVVARRPEGRSGARGDSA